MWSICHEFRIKKCIIVLEKKTFEVNLRKMIRLLGNSHHLHKNLKKHNCIIIII